MRLFGNNRHVDETFKKGDFIVHKKHLKDIYYDEILSIGESKCLIRDKFDGVCYWLDRDKLEKEYVRIPRGNKC